MGNAASRVQYHIVHIRGKDNILADAISRLHTINVYEEALENEQHHSLGTQDATHSSQKAKQIQQLNSAMPPATSQHEHYNVVKSTKTR